MSATNLIISLPKNWIGHFQGKKDSACILFFILFFILFLNGKYSQLGSKLRESFSVWKENDMFFFFCYFLFLFGFLLILLGELIKPLFSIFLLSARRSDSDKWPQWKLLGKSDGITPASIGELQDCSKDAFSLWHQFKEGRGGRENYERNIYYSRALLIFCDSLLEKGCKKN